jgi:hypothetical protein
VGVPCVLVDLPGEVDQLQIVKGVVDDHPITTIINNITRLMKIAFDDQKLSVIRDQEGRYHQKPHSHCYR